jgi:hypothetical protein
MSFFTNNIADLNEADLDWLFQQQFAEWKTIEYKEQLNVGTESEKKKFLSQITSFANAAGGNLLYGVRADKGVPQSPLTGLLLSNADQQVLALEEIVRMGVRPRIPGVVMRAVPLSNGRYVIVIRIPQSWAGPHQVTYNGDLRFYSRASNGKYTLDVDELRSLFEAATSAGEKIRNFRADRLGKLLSGEGPVPLRRQPIYALHIVPVNAFSGVHRYDLERLRELHSHLMPFGGMGFNPRHNYDGYLAYSPDNEVAAAYTQVFRNGIIESVRGGYSIRSVEEKRIPHVAFEKDAIEALTRHLKLMKEMGVELPTLAMLSLVGVGGFRLHHETGFYLFGEVWAIDRDVLMLPDVLIEDYECDAASVLKDSFDVLWQSAGYPRCLNYDEEGNRIQ